MISIFNDLEDKKLIKFNIDNYTTNYYYEQYSKIKDVSIDSSLKSEIKDLINEESPSFYDFKSPVQSFFNQACLLDSLKKVIQLKSANDADIYKSITKYKKKFNYYPEIQDYQNYEKFLKDFSRRKEFNIHQIPKNKDKQCNQSNFELAPHQLYLKNLLS